jgi:hypothetical protein
MATFSYNRDIPDGPNNPSVDQPNMKINTNSTDDILQVDHVSFETPDGGTHKQVTLSSKNTAGAQVDPASTIYSDNGVADASHPQLYWRNSQRIFPVSAVRAFANFITGTNGATAIVNGFNVVSVTVSTFSGSTKTATIVLENGAVNGNNVAVFVFISNPSSNGTISHTFADPTLVVNGIPVGSNTNVLVMQI